MAAKQWMMERLRASRGRGSRGMTLIEIMVVVVIISLVAGVVGVSVLQRLGDAQVRLAQTQLKNVSEALDKVAKSRNIKLK